MQNAFVISKPMCYDTNIGFKKIKTIHASGMIIMKLNQGFIFRSKVVVET